MEYPEATGFLFLVCRYCVFLWFCPWWLEDRTKSKKSADQGDDGPWHHSGESSRSCGTTGYF
ncbi:uncharacterized protein BDV14DRAFT_183255 [Aspergillus stella-maris]|uniref:uncharacterized protein n=1 Tax=Aspergillus stella-maris TaxID=1810926 RepID=UPI003CCCA7C8